MKKFSLGVFMLLFVLIFAGCGDQKEQEVINTSLDENAVREQAIKDIVDGETGELYTGIAKGKQMKCKYTVETPGAENAQAVVYLEGIKYRTEIISEGMNPEGVIFDGEALYSWDMTTKSGMKMDMQCMEEFEEMIGGDLLGTEIDTLSPSSEDFVKDLPDMQCEEVKGVDLTIPDDVEFMNQCDMLRDQLEEEE